MLALSTRSQRAQWKVSSAGRDGSGFIGGKRGKFTWMWDQFGLRLLWRLRMEIKKQA